MAVLSLMTGFNKVPLSLNAALALSNCSSQSYRNRGTQKTTGHPEDLQGVDSEEDKMSVSHKLPDESDDSLPDPDVAGVE